MYLFIYIFIHTGSNGRKWETLAFFTKTEWTCTVLAVQLSVGEGVLSESAYTYVGKYKYILQYVIKKIHTHKSIFEYYICGYILPIIHIYSAIWFFNLFRIVNKMQHGSELRHQDSSCNLHSINDCHWKQNSFMWYASGWV